MAFHGYLSINGARQGLTEASIGKHCRNGHTDDRPPRG